MYVMGWRAFCDVCVTHVLSPDEYMKQIFWYVCKFICVDILMHTFWTIVIWLALQGKSVALWICITVIAHTPLTFLAFFLPPLVNMGYFSKQIARILRRAGEREAIQITVCRALVTLLTAIVALKSAALVIGKIQATMFEIQAFEDDCKKPEANEADVVRANIWHKEDYKVTPQDVGKCTMSWKGMNAQEFVRVLNRNILYIESLFLS